MGRRGFRLAGLVAGTVALGSMAACSQGEGTATPPVETSATQPDSGEVAWNHDPESGNGPDEWGGLDPSWTACSDGTSQSPMALENAEPAELPALQLDYETVPLLVENTGHAVEVPQPADGGGTLRVGSDRYTLVQWHLHAPSEHVLDGRRFAMEIHLVHTDASGGTAVVAVLADEAAEGADAAAASGTAAGILDSVVAHAPEAAEDETETGLEVSARDVLPFEAGADGTAQTSDYLRYDGSLTTPPCTEGVRWIVLTPEIEVSASAVENLHGLIAELPAYAGFPDNDRPLQPANGRVVQRAAG